MVTLVEVVGHVCGTFPSVDGVEMSVGPVSEGFVDVTYVLQSTSCVHSAQWNDMASN